MQTGEDSSPAPRGRPRDPEREARVLVAAVEEYAHRGWAGLTMDGVAKRAGVGKSTIYLRWANKEDLLAAAVQKLAENIAPVDTGSVRGDVELLATNLQQSYGGNIGWGLVRILIDASGSGQGVNELREVNEAHRSAALAIFERGVARGELRPGVPGQLLINALYGTLQIYRMMQPYDALQGTTPDPEAVVRDVVDLLMRALGPWLTDGAGA